LVDTHIANGVARITGLFGRCILPLRARVLADGGGSVGVSVFVDRIGSVDAGIPIDRIGRVRAGVIMTFFSQVHRQRRALRRQNARDGDGLRQELHLVKGWHCSEFQERA
jgi:hypothetical protein